MENADVENQPILERIEYPRLVKGNDFKISRANSSGLVLFRDFFHTLLSMHPVWIFVTLVTAYVQCHLPGPFP